MSLYFLETPVLRFALLAYYRRNNGMECVIVLIVRLTLPSRRLLAQSLTTETLEQVMKYVQS